MKPLLTFVALAAGAIFLAVEPTAIAQTKAPAPVASAPLSASTIKALQDALNKQGIAVKADGVLEMPMPDNTLPMMTGFGPFGPVEMGGMFSVVKVRNGVGRDDYKNPPDYEHPPGTVAYEFRGKAPQPVRQGPPPSGERTRMEFNVVKPGSKGAVKHQH